MAFGTLTITLNNAHIYEHHVAQAYEQIERAPRPLPTLEIPDRADGKPFDILKWTYQDIVLTGYDPHPPIKMEVAV